ncbi:MAG: cysteine desulfurase family protein [Saprospiraceae bacterium]|nr:cysteine desulfurase family protein [Saprospiraceae bacterium]
MNRVYFDNAASTPVLPEVKEVIQSTLSEAYGNPSSLHREGRIGRTIIEDARKNIAHLLNASIGEIFFTSGGTESNNTAIKGAVRDLAIKRIISSPIEHPCVMEVLRSLEPDVKIEYVKLDAMGKADLDDLERRIKNGSRPLVSLMHINNEIGTINNIKLIGDLCQQNDALFHTDTVQGIGYFKYDLNDLNVNFLSASAHKFHGPKGVGVLYMNSGSTVGPLIHGGQQERKVRAGTENIPYIAGMSIALTLAYDNLLQRRNHISSLRESLIERLKNVIPEVKIVNPSPVDCHYKIINLAVPLTEKSSMAIPNLDIMGFAVSGGSACSSGAETDSHVYDTLFPGEELKLLRLSFSHDNTEEEIYAFVDALKKIL